MNKEYIVKRCVYLGLNTIFNGLKDHNDSNCRIRIIPRPLYIVLGSHMTYIYIRAGVAKFRLFSSRAWLDEIYRGVSYVILFMRSYSHIVLIERKSSYYSSLSLCLNIFHIPKQDEYRHPPPLLFPARLPTVVFMGSRVLASYIT